MLLCASTLAYRLLIESLITKDCTADRTSREGIKMDFALTLLISNGLMAAIIYLVVTWIWED